MAKREPEAGPSQDLRGDAVGDTMYSERWILRLLIRLTKFLAGEEECTADFENALCTLWDMCAEKDVVLLLKKHGMLSLAANTLLKSEKPRLSEIMVGIIGNMCSVKNVREECEQRPEIARILMDLLSLPDGPTLIQVMRVLQIFAWDVNNSCHSMPAPSPAHEDGEQNQNDHQEIEEQDFIPENVGHGHVNHGNHGNHGNHAYLNGVNEPASVNNIDHVPEDDVENGYHDEMSGASSLSDDLENVVGNALDLPVPMYNNLTVEQERNASTGIVSSPGYDVATIEEERNASTGNVSCAASPLVDGTPTDEKSTEDMSSPTSSVSNTVVVGEERKTSSENISSPGPSTHDNAFIDEERKVNIGNVSLSVSSGDTAATSEVKNVNPANVISSLLNLPVPVFDTNILENIYNSTENMSSPASPDSDTAVTGDEGNSIDPDRERSASERVDDLGEGDIEKETEMFSSINNSSDHPRNAGTDMNADPIVVCNYEKKDMAKSGREVLQSNLHVNFSVASHMNVDVAVPGPSNLAVPGTSRANAASYPSSSSSPSPSTSSSSRNVMGNSGPAVPSGSGVNAGGAGHDEEEEEAEVVEGSEIETESFTTAGLWYQQFLNIDSWLPEVIFILNSSKNAELLGLTWSLLQTLCYIPVSSSYLFYNIVGADVMRCLLESFKEYFGHYMDEEGTEVVNVDRCRKGAILWTSIIYSFTLHPDSSDIICQFKADVMKNIFQMLKFYNQFLPLDEDLLEYLFQTFAILDEILVSQPYELSSLHSGVHGAIHLLDELTASKEEKQENNIDAHYEEEAIDSLKRYLKNVLIWVNSLRTEERVKEHFQDVRDILLAKFG